MHVHLKRFILGCLFFSTFVGHIYGDKTTLTVLSYESSPFMMFTPHDQVGFGKNLLNELAVEADVKFIVEDVDNIHELFTQLEQNKGDLGLANISITADREKTLDFSHSIYDSGLDILVHEKKHSIFHTLDTFILALLSPKVLQTLFHLFLGLFIIANLIWFVEKDKNETIPSTYIKGLFESLWWAVVTLTTVGYGDQTPKGYTGRTIAMIWMFLGIFFISFFTASITSSLTIERLKGDIRGPQDLPGKRIGTVKGTTSEEYLLYMNLKPTLYPHIQEAIDAFEQHQLDAIVFDQPILKYYEVTESQGHAYVVGKLFDLQHYGIAFPNDSPHFEKINQALLRLKENGVYDVLIEKWFKKLD